MSSSIDNPVINGPYDEPARHFVFEQGVITSRVADGRRPSENFIPIAPVQRAPQLELQGTTEPGQRIEQNTRVNEIRERVRAWRHGGWVDVTPTTRRLLEYWTNPDRERRLFFCQIEAVETAIYLAEVAGKHGDQRFSEGLRRESDRANPGLFRVAHKMATGTGKTVVMAMLIAWQTLNRLARPHDSRFTDAFLIVTPGVTIRERLQVLRPRRVPNYYAERDLLAPGDLALVGAAKIVITNDHALRPRQRQAWPAATRQLLGYASDVPAITVESEAQMVQRVCADLAGREGIVVFNDEAHHCYHKRVDECEGTGEVPATPEEREEVLARDGQARRWATGLSAVARRMGIKTVYDLSATPFFLQGSGYPEGALFPWVVSDFSLIDAIESGLVKVPRVPVSDDSAIVAAGGQPVYRDLWPHIRDALPRRVRQKNAGGGGPSGVEALPDALLGAIEGLYRNYEKYFRSWAEAADGDEPSSPPVMIVVCSNTTVSQLVYEYIAGYERIGAAGAVHVEAGRCELLRNEQDGQWLDGRPRTILVDSPRLDSGEALTPEFRRAAAREIEDFRQEWAARTGADGATLTDQDLLREVMNTVGKPGRLGERIRCVVSVGMLTEGWDANTVTHILGVRAFSTQLLCEQVVGRALRRTSYDVGEEGRLPPEYAEVFGVPFAFIRSTGEATAPPPRRERTRVFACGGREACEVTFPQVIGYRYEVTQERLQADFGGAEPFTLDRQLIPHHVDTMGVNTEAEVYDLEYLRRLRPKEIAFHLAKLVLDLYFGEPTAGTAFAAGVPEGEQHGRYVNRWLFPQVLTVTRAWVADRLVTPPSLFLQAVWHPAYRRLAAEDIYRSIVRGEKEQRLRPVLRPDAPEWSTARVDFETSRPTWETHPQLSQVSHVVCDSGWEEQVAEMLERLAPLVRAYAKNDGLGFEIPYQDEGAPRVYRPDFLIRVDDGRGAGDLLTLILEVTGERRPAKAAKAAAVRSLWIPAVHNHGGYGRWAFVEVHDVHRTAELVAEAANRPLPNLLQH